MIAIMNYGIGNLGSVKNALDFLGFDAKITSDSNEILSADKVILPGVGAFSIAMDTFKSYGFVQVVDKLMEKNTPILGICVGMQMLFQESEEYGIHKGLGLLQGRIIKFNQKVDNVTYKIPQMGWNQIHVVKENPLLFFEHFFIKFPLTLLSFYIKKQKKQTKTLAFCCNCILRRYMIYCFS